MFFPVIIPFFGIGGEGARNVTREDKRLLAAVAIAVATLVSGVGCLLKGPAGLLALPYLVLSIVWLTAWSSAASHLIGRELSVKGRWGAALAVGGTLCIAITILSALALAMAALWLLGVGPFASLF